MSAPSSWPGHRAIPWDTHLAAQAQPQPVEHGLSMAQAHRLQRYHDRLLCALAARDREALRQAKQGILKAAYGPAAADAACPAWRRAMRTLSWQMAALLLPRGRQ